MIHEKVTVVIPCYNVSDCISEAVHQLLNGPALVPVVLIDNGSTDNTYDVLLQLKENFSHLVIDRESKKGACAARNRGLTHVQTEFVKFLDADDLITQEMLQSQWNEASLAQCDILFAPYEKRKVNGESSIISPSHEVWKGLFTTRLGLTSALLFKTKAVIQAGGWNEEIQSSQEYDLIFRLLQRKSSFSFSTVVGAVVRERASGQISTSNPIPRWTNYLALRKRILSFLEESETVYFLNEKHFFLQAYFDVLHIVFPYLPDESNREYNRVIKGRFTPEPSAACSSLFVKLVRVFGFKNAEKIKSLLSK